MKTINYSRNQFYDTGSCCISIRVNVKIQTTVLKILKHAVPISVLYYKPMTIVNDCSRVVNKLEASLTADARVVIYNRHMFIAQATEAILIVLPYPRVTM
jgi:hypothetical protein